MKKKDFEVVIKWTWKDIQRFKQTWTKKQCLKALASVGDELEERSIDEGWFALNGLLASYAE